MRNFHKKIACTLTGVMLCGTLMGAVPVLAKDAEKYTNTDFAMDTVVSETLYTTGDDLNAEIGNKLREIESGLLSWTDEDSQISKLNAAGGDGGQHGGFPAKVAVAVGGGVGFAQLCGQRPEGQQAQHAHHDEQQRLHPEQIGEQTADQRGGRADGKPDRGHIKGTTLQHQKADRGNEPEKWGGVHGQFPPYGPIIGHPLGGRSSVFY